MKRYKDSNFGTPRISVTAVHFPTGCQQKPIDSVSWKLCVYCENKSPVRQAPRCGLWRQ